MSHTMQLPDSGVPSLTSATLDNTIGAAFIGVIVASVLFGFSSLQAYLYYHQWYSDTIVHRIAVGVVWVLDAFHLALTCHAVYYYTVTHFGNVPALMHVVWSIKLQITINVVIILMVQTLYAYRVWLLGGYHKGALGYVVMGVVLAGFVIGIVLAHQIYTIDYFVDLSSVAWAVDSALAASTAIDFVLAAAMCFYLTKSKGFESRLNSKISRVMQYTLSSGLFTSACSLSALFTYIFMPNTMIFFAIESLLTKLYIASFLTMLNARERASDKMDTEASGGSRYSSTMPRFSRKPSRTLKRSISSRRFLTLSSPTEEPLRTPRDSEIPSVYSAASDKMSFGPPSAQSEYFTSFPSPAPVKLTTLRTHDLDSVSPTVPARPEYMERW